MDAAKTVRLIDAAVYDLAGMEMELRLPAFMFVKGTLTEAKLRPSYISINRYLTDNVALTRLADDKGFAKLPAKAQAEAVWLDGFMTQLTAIDPLLDKAWKLARKAPEGQEVKIIKHAKDCLKTVRTPPKSLGRLLKRLIQGEQPSKTEAPMIGYLPIAIICWAIADQVDEAMLKRPR